MTRPVLTFFNNKGGVGKTMLAYHVAWMLNELGKTVVIWIWTPRPTSLRRSSTTTGSRNCGSAAERRKSIYGALAPLFEGEGGIGDPYVQEIAPNLGLVPGDLLLSGTEQELSLAWPGSMEQQVRALRVTSAFATVAQRAAEQSYAEVVLIVFCPISGRSTGPPWSHPIMWWSRSGPTCIRFRDSATLAPRWTGGVTDGRTSWSARHGPT